MNLKCIGSILKIVIRRGINIMYKLTIWKENSFSMLNLYYFK